MKLYAEVRARRLRQVFGDAAAGAWAWLWIWFGIHVHDLVASLAVAGRLLEDAGSDLEGATSSLQDSVVRVPVVGSFLEQRFEGMVGVGASLRRSGASQVETVESLAMWMGVLVALLPVLMVLGIWGTRRLRWIRDATAAAHLRSDPANLYLFAFRAVSTRPIWQFRSAADLEAVRRFHDGDYAPMARLELVKLGLREPAAPNPAGRPPT